MKNIEKKIQFFSCICLVFSGKSKDCQAYFKSIDAKIILNMNNKALLCFKNN